MFSHRGRSKKRSGMEVKMGEDTQGKGIRYSQDADDQNAIWDIKENYSQMEKVITTQLSPT